MSAIWDREDEKPSKMPSVDPYPPDYDAKANEEAGWGVGPQKGPSSVAKIEAERKAVINWMAADAKGMDPMTYALKKTIEHLQSKKKD